MSEPYTISENGDSLEVSAAEAVTLTRIGLIYQCDECEHTFHIVAPNGYFLPAEMSGAWAKIETALETLRS